MAGLAKGMKGMGMLEIDVLMLEPCHFALPFGCPS
jgi:hypothetical protein